MKNEKLASNATAAARTIAKRLRAANAITVADYMENASEREAAEMQHLLSSIAIYEAAKQQEGNVA